jgi:hypothetical protein
MAVFKMTHDQMTFATFAFTDAAGNTVPLDQLTLVLDTSDDTIVQWEKRDPTTGAPDPNGQDAVVAQGPTGAVQVHVTATNADGTQVVLVGDLEILAADAIAGTITFGPAVNKP